MTFSKKFIIVAVAFLASFTACKAHRHGDHHDHEVHHHDHGRLLKATQQDPTPQNRTCGTKDPSKNDMSMANTALSALAPDSVNTAAAIVVDTYFWSITDGNIGVLTTKQLLAQLNALNDAYATIGVNFVLQDSASFNNTNWFYNSYSSFETEQEMKSNLRQGGKSALNVYFADLSNTGFIGYAYYPWDYIGDDISLDGVAIDYRSIPGGSFTNFNEGKTLVHEVGHWLGLSHTFQGGCGSSPTTSGDYVSDTPAEAFPSSDTNICPIGRDTCTGQNFPGVDVSTLKPSFVLSLRSKIESL
jgi:hypothetical protein